jgi:hypothetical protein
MVWENVLFEPSAAANVPLTCVTNLHGGTNRPQHGCPTIRLEILAWYVQLNVYVKRQKIAASANSTNVIYIRCGH